MLDEKKTLIFPEFIIGGAQKCATSAHAIWLDTHPDMVCSVPKEPDYFSNAEKYNNLKDYSGFFSKESDLTDKTLFEASTGYFTDSIAANQIKKTLGENVKMIFILKDPLSRTISAYYHMVKHNAETRSVAEVFEGLPETREEVLSFENDELERAYKRGLIDNRRQYRYDDHFLQFRYVSNSLYADHYKRYEALFGAENILLLNLDNMHQDPASYFNKITDFVGVENFSSYPDVTDVHNKTKVAFYLLSPWIRHSKIMFGACRGLHRAMNIFGRGHLLAKTPPEVPKPIKRKLESLFKIEKSMLEGL